MAPEVKMNQRVPFKSDMYSLGLILHFMMAKSLPKDQKINIPKQYSQEIYDLVCFLLRPEPDKRPSIR